MIDRKPKASQCAGCLSLLVSGRPEPARVDLDYGPSIVCDSLEAGKLLELAPLAWGGQKESPRKRGKLEEEWMKDQDRCERAEK